MLMVNNIISRTKVSINKLGKWEFRLASCRVLDIRFIRSGPSNGISLISFIYGWLQDAQYLFIILCCCNKISFRCSTWSFKQTNAFLYFVSFNISITTIAKRGLDLVIYKHYGNALFTLLLLLQNEMPTV